MESTESQLLEAVASSPNSIAARLMYADWLEERGDVRAEYLRLELRLHSMMDSDDRYQQTKAQLRQLKTKLDANWRRDVTFAPIENCGVIDAPEGLFDFQCPRTWDQLNPTDASDVRFCTACQQHVHLCGSAAEARSLGSQGACIAIDVCAKPAHNRPRLVDVDVEPNRRLGKVAPPRSAVKLKKYPSRAIRTPGKKRIRRHKSS